MNAFPNINPRIKAWGTSKLRSLNASSIRKVLKENTILLQDGEIPIAVIVSYERYMDLQALVHAQEKP